MNIVGFWTEDHLHAISCTKEFCKSDRSLSWTSCQDGIVDNLQANRSTEGAAPHLEVFCFSVCDKIGTYSGTGML